jgi:CheY-like chemotaxis protein
VDVHAKIMMVDEVRQNVRLLDALLTSHSYAMASASSERYALRRTCHRVAWQQHTLHWSAIRRS